MKFKKILLLCVTLISIGICPFIADAKTQEKPLIGIMLNSGGNEGYSQYPWYAIRKNYSEVVTQMGGIPVFIGHDAQNTEDYLEVLDGIVLTGGDLNSPEEVCTTGIKGKVDPKRFPRQYVEFELVNQAYKRDIPVLGICAGMQNMNVAMGGTLYSNLKESLGTTIQHRQENREKTHHSIQVVENSHLYKIIKTSTFPVNSNHNAGINKLGSAFKVSAVAPDGVIEGIEAPEKRFFIGVIWHPEFLLTSNEIKLWQSFVQQALIYRQQRKA